MKLANYKAWGLQWYDNSMLNKNTITCLFLRLKENHKVFLEFSKRMCYDVFVAGLLIDDCI